MPPTSEEVSAVLQEASRKIKTGWSPYGAAWDNEGRAVQSESDKAVKWSMLAAVHAAAGGDHRLSQAAGNHIKEVLDGRTTEELMEWENAPRRKLTDLTDALDDAAKHSRGDFRGSGSPGEAMIAVPLSASPSALDDARDRVNATQGISQDRKDEIIRAIDGDEPSYRATLGELNLLLNTTDQEVEAARQSRSAADAMPDLSPQPVKDGKTRKSRRPRRSSAGNQELRSALPPGVSVAASGYKDRY